MATPQRYVCHTHTFGSHRYGDRAQAAAQGMFGRAFQSLMNTASVARKFDTSRRREVLSFKHHAEVAALPEAVAATTTLPEQLPQDRPQANRRSAVDAVIGGLARVRQPSPAARGLEPQGLPHSALERRPGGDALAQREAAEAEAH